MFKENKIEDIFNYFYDNINQGLSYDDLLSLVKGKGYGL